MEIKKLWEKYKFPNCDNCEKDCKGRLDYNNLCANLNYLKEYAEYNYEKNKESFEELKNLTKNDSLYIFSFGCGLGLDYIGAKGVLVGDIKYYGIDKCNWAIKRTESYKNFQPKLPKTIKYDEGIFLLTAVNENAVICFFNSLFTISNNSDLEDQLVEALRNKKNFISFVIIQ